MNEKIHPPSGAAEHEAENWQAGDPNLERDVWRALRACAQLGAGSLGRGLRRETGLSLPRYALLAALLNADEGLTMGELARQLMVSNANVTAAVDALAKDGWVVRRGSADDRRRVIACLTEPARRTLEAIEGIHGKGVEELLAGLSPLELRLLAGLLSKLLAHLEMSHGKTRQAGKGACHPAATDAGPLGWGWV